MAIRSALFLLVGLGVIALGWLLGADEPPGARPGAADAASGDGGDAPAGAPVLAIAERPPKPEAAAAPLPAPEGRAREAVPQRFREGSWYGTAASRAEFARWLLADPERLDDYLAWAVWYYARRSGSARDLYSQSYAAFRWQEEGWGGLPGHLVERLGQAASPLLRAAQLGALAGMRTQTAPALDAVMRVIASPQEAPGVRVLGAMTLRHVGGEGLAEAEAVSGLLRDRVAALQARASGGPLDSRSEEARQVRTVIGVMRSMGAGRFVQAALEAYGTLRVEAWSKDIALAFLIQGAPSDERVQAILLENLGSKHRSTRLQALQTLAKQSGGPQMILDALVTASGTLRVEAVGVLAQTSIERAPLGPALLPALLDGHAGVRSTAVSLIHMVEPKVETVLPYIEKLFASEDPARWLTATRAVGALSTAEGEKDAAIRMLYTAARLPSPQVRRTAVQILLMHDGQGAAVIPLLSDLLRDADVSVRQEAVDALGELSSGRDSDAAKTLLEAALGDTDSDVRELAAYWLRPEGTDDDDD